MLLRKSRLLPATNFWPALLDVVIATLMVFILSMYLPIAMNVDPPPTPAPSDVEATRVRALEAQFIDKLRQELAEDITAGNLEVEQHLGLVHIRFNDRVLFDSGQHKLRDPGKQLLARFGHFLAAAWRPGVRRVQVEGHTDNVPFAVSRARYPTNNWELSSARATVVTLFLLEAPFGPPATLFSANGYSSNRPLADNTGASGRAHNRRVEIELVFSGGERP